MQKAFKSGGGDVPPIAESISDMACQLAESHASSHSLCAADAQIAVTAISNALPLLTADARHLTVGVELS